MPAYRYYTFYFYDTYRIVYEIALYETVGGNPITITNAMLSASDYYSNNLTYSVDKAFDNNSATYWRGNNANGWITIDFGAGNEKSIAEYKISTSSDAHKINHWVLTGSNDNTNRYVLARIDNYNWQSNYTQKFSDLISQYTKQTSLNDFHTTLKNDNPTALYLFSEQDTNILFDYSDNSLNARYDDTDFFALNDSMRKPAYIPNNHNGYSNVWDSGHRVLMPDVSQFNLSGGTAFSVELFFASTLVRSYVNDTTQDQYLFDFRESPYLSLVANDTLNFNVWNGSTFAGISYRDSTIVTGQYVHVVCVYTGSSADNKLMLYINGELKSSFVLAGVPVFSTYSNTYNERRIGCNISARRYFNGYIETFAVYKGTALSAQQIQNHYEASGLVNTDIPDRYYADVRNGTYLVLKPDATHKFFGEKAVLSADYDYYDGGYSKLSGYLTAESVPISRRVDLLDERTRRLIRSTLSRASDGYYEFKHIDDRDYIVLAVDYAKVFKCVGSDKVRVDATA